jgi:hypothetical protein
MHTPDTLASDLLTAFAVDIIKAVSKRTKIDPDELSKAIPGLIHSHWYIENDVDGCLYCARTTRLQEKQQL